MQGPLERAVKARLVPMVRQAATRYGPFVYNPNDQYVGRAVEVYGEVQELEVEFLRSICRPESYVIDAGANIGSHTVPLAQHVGPEGRVLAFEPQAAIFALLCENIELAELENVTAYHAALGRATGTISIPDIDYDAPANFGGVEVSEFTNGSPVALRTLDEFVTLPRLDLVKIDVEGMEREVLAGGERLINQFRPLLYVENDRDEKSAALIDALFGLRYRLFWHLPPLFNPKNFRGNRENVFGSICSWNMLCVPAETPLEIIGFDEITHTSDRPFQVDANFERGVADDEQGRACVAAGKFERAEALFLSAAQRIPNSADPHVNLAFLYHVTGKIDAAIAEGERAVGIEPNHRLAHLNLATSLLLAGHYPRGFIEYEWRPMPQIDTRVPLWDGSNLDGGRLLITREQGFGDFILYSRFFAQLRERGATVCVQVPASARELFAGFDGIDETIDELDVPDDSYGAYLPIASLPHRLRLFSDEIPASVPYLWADDARVAAFSECFSAAAGSRKIGIVWAGSPHYEMDRYRSCPLSAFDALAGIDDVAWISLQKEAPFEQLERSALRPLRIDDRLVSFADTGAAIAALDLLICVDTSVAHLAGALGKPVWLLNGFGNYWLWGLRQSTTPWYPTMRQFHQPSAGDWKGLFDSVKEALIAEVR